MKKENTIVDVFKFLFSILVVGIHTEPFGWNIWLDRGFGIITRLCVPFFFCFSGYFFFKNKTNLFSYLKRLFVLYVFWSFVYLPFDISNLKGMNFVSVIKRYFWTGNEHALWYICGSIIATIFVYVLSKCMNTKKILLITMSLLIIGCMASTWNPLVCEVSAPIGTGLKNIFDLVGGTRTGITYGAVYVTIGKYLAEQTEKSEKHIIRDGIGFLISMVALAIESLIFVFYFHTKETVLWFFVIPATYFLANVLIKIQLNIPNKLALELRKMSTLIYVSHSLFVLLFSTYLCTWKLFIVVVICTLVFSAVILKLSKKVPILKYIY